MAERSTTGATGGSGDGLQAGEKEQLAYALETRYAPHLEAAVAAVRQAEQDVDEAQTALVAAQAAEQDQTYRSDPLVFMRDSVAEELDGLDRRSNAKKVRASYRFLLDRAVELAAAEVRRFHDDQAAEKAEREGGIAACEAAVARAQDRLSAAREMQERVLAAESAARQGLALLVDKLGT